MLSIRLESERDMYTILICDDDKDIRRALKIYLSGEGYRTLEAADGKQCLELLEKEAVDLVLMDVMMPGLDGLGATMQLRQELHQVHVSRDVVDYIMNIVEATRNAGVLVGGVSTRGAIALYKAAQVTAAMEGRDYVIPEDVVREALPVLTHRLATASGSRADGENYLIRNKSFLHKIKC